MRPSCPDLTAKFATKTYIHTTPSSVQRVTCG
jgi:hypothetical protein